MSESQFTSEGQFGSEEAQTDLYEEVDDNKPLYDSDMSETDSANDNADEEVGDDGDDEEEEAPRADLSSGWGRIIYMPFRRGKRVELDVCRATNREGTEGSFNRVVITQSKNPALHHQARRSLWGDLWPLRSEKNSKYYM